MHYFINHEPHIEQKKGEQSIILDSAANNISRLLLNNKLTDLLQLNNHKSFQVGQSWRRELLINTVYVHLEQGWVPSPDKHVYLT